MKVAFHIQDPGAKAMTYGIDAIAHAADGANSGQAFFAFATVAGVDLLLACESIRKLMISGRFEVIVGIDAITNRQTLEKLREASRDRPGLHPRVFWNLAAGIFHPKFCRFRNDTHETWIIGSGNLTPRGLRDNYEAFTVIAGTRSEVKSLNKSLQNFLDNHSLNIREIDDEALQRASKNKFTHPLLDIEPPESRPILKRSGASQKGVRFLIAELPKGGARWQQANFNLVTAREFFGIEPESNSFRKELFFNEIDKRGSSLKEEVRRFTYTKSKNLRVQLAAKNGRDYPTVARPIAVFRELKPRHFAYQLLLPSEKGFVILKKLLDRYESGEVRRHITTIDKLSKSWADCPLYGFK